MTIDHNKVKQIAEAYTAAWNSGSAEAVAEFYAKGGRIVINRGEPWEGRARVAEMAAGFFADVPELKLVYDGCAAPRSRRLPLDVHGYPFRTDDPCPYRKRHPGWHEWRDRLG